MSRPPAILLTCCLLVGGLLPLHAAAAEEDDLGIRVPEGFEVSLYADDDLAHDIFSMTIDAQGRVVVAGLDYVKTLHDRDGDGRADAATRYSSIPASGAHGMLFDGPDLVCTGDNSVMRLRDADGDGTADGPPEVWTRLRNPEHGANGLTRGPDGCIYLICGNDAGIDERHAALATSPVKQPHCGGIVRFSPSGQVLDVFAHGFRNPYDLDFGPLGHLFTVDADGERDHHLPWYAPNRLFDVAQGQHHGWMLQGWTRSWNRPQSFFDNVERMVEIGRGSPTGVVAYRHRQFPAHYRGGLFTACWTFGRVYYFPLEPRGATLTAPLETFMETTGDVGFAPCDLAVGPEGDLFVAIGGRRTRGSVFRVRYRGADVPAPAGNPLDRVLAADQPQSAWSRARWLPLARELGADAFRAAAVDPAREVAARIRAVEVLVDVFGGVPVELAEQLAAVEEPTLRARVAWALSRGPQSAAATRQLCSFTADENPAVQRATWEALAIAPSLAAEETPGPDWGRGLSSPERRVRAAAIAAARGPAEPSYRDFAARTRVARDAVRLRLAQLWIDLPESSQDEPATLSSDQFSTCVDVFAIDQDVPLRLEAVRLLQIGLGDLHVQEDQAEVYSGYLGNATARIAAADRRAIVTALVPAFPSGDAELDRELARLLGMLGADDPAFAKALARKWTPDSVLEDDVHYLIVAALLAGDRSTEVTRATADCLLALHAKLEAAGQFASRNWPYRVAEAFDELCRRDPALVAAIAAHSALAHPGHSLFVERLSGPRRAAATRRLWSAVVDAGGDGTPELIALAGRLPGDEALSLVRSQWADGGLRDPIVLALAQHPQNEDRAKFVEALASPQPAVVQQAAEALVALGVRSTPAEMAAVLRALKLACLVEKQTEPRRSLAYLLNFWTEDGADLDWDGEPAHLYDAWQSLFAEYYPAEAARLEAASPSSEAWQRRFAAIDWSAGDAARGRAVFERRACHRCHQQSGHLGPELTGAVRRMSRDDLLSAIVDPNLEVSPAYWTTAIATDAGQVYHGLVVYESPESTLLQTGPDTTVRITDAETSDVRTSTQSLMPLGLLDTLTDQDVSDLYRYLKTLGAE